MLPSHQPSRAHASSKPPSPPDGPSETTLQQGSPAGSLDIADTHMRRSA